MCEIQDCGVCSCDKPPEFLSEKIIDDARESDADCQQQLDSKQIIHMSTNDIFAKPWNTPEDTVELPHMEVVNLLENPELYTGYNGSKVWVCVYPLP